MPMATTLAADVVAVVLVEFAVLVALVPPVVEHVNPVVLTLRYHVEILQYDIAQTLN